MKRFIVILIMMGSGLCVCTAVKADTIVSITGVVKPSIKNVTFKENKENPLAELKKINGHVCAASKVHNKSNETTGGSDNNKCQIKQKIISTKLDDITKSTRIKQEVVLGYSGLGNTKPKFIIKDKLIRSDSDFVTSESKELDASPSTTAKAKAEWESEATIINEKFVFRAELKVAAEVKVEAGSKLKGQAAAQSGDPMFFIFEDPGLFNFDMQLLELIFSSTDAEGFGHMDIAAAMQGVSLGGQALDDELFRLTFDMAGVLNDPSDVKINFLPWAGLGMSESDIADYINYVSSSLDSFSGNTLSFVDNFFLIGGASPIPELEFSYQANQDVILEYDITADVSHIPEPATMILFGAGMIGAYFIRKYLTRDGL